MTTINVTTMGQIIRVLFPIYLLQSITEPVLVPTRLPGFSSGGKLTGVLSIYLDDNCIGIRLCQSEFRRGACEEIKNMYHYMHYITCK